LAVLDGEGGGESLGFDGGEEKVKTKRDKNVGDKRLGGLFRR